KYKNTYQYKYLIKLSYFIFLKLLTELFIVRGRSLPPIPPPKVSLGPTMGRGTPLADAARGWVL
ncbi:MAG: hypothetical protein RSD40_05345, partial [Bacilli bacterium]